MNYHFIAIGGSIMHNLAIALHLAGHTVTGSDDVIYDPARTYLAAYGLLPATEGWDPSRIHTRLDGIILGMHARADNPELQKAKKLGLPIYSFPAFVYAQSKNMERIAITGSHGKTTITAMVMHILRKAGKPFNYLVGARLEGYDTMVRLDPSCPRIVLEGDEYLTSPLDLRPKFLHYHPQVVVLSGIAWDHINAFPTEEDYIHQFALLLQQMKKEETLIYNEDDPKVVKLVAQTNVLATKVPYRIPAYEMAPQGSTVTVDKVTAHLKIFGKHNLSNAAAAVAVCAMQGIPAEQGWQYLADFTGAAKRLQLIGENTSSAIYRDFAHAPSKVSASVEAMRERYPERQLVAVLELHTFSSLTSAFLPHYHHTLQSADIAIVYLNPEAMAQKGKTLSAGEVEHHFDHPHLLVTTDPAKINQTLRDMVWKGKNLLLMSSGNLGGLNMTEINSFVGLT